MKTIALFEGELLDGRFCRIWTDEESVYVKLDNVTMESPKDHWFDLVNVFCLAYDKQDALETGNVEELKRVGDHLKERERLMKESERD